MPLFSSKPVTVEAVQITQALIEDHIFKGERLPFNLMLDAASFNREKGTVQSWTLRAPKQRVKADEWIVLDEVKSMSVMTPEHFANTYEPVRARDAA